MEKSDAQLIHEILSGNDAAFGILVDKYQKSIHALAWRKIGDFHYAEEIAQDTFLQAYRKLATLRNPHQFAGWLYVIANRLCLNWIRKQKPAMQSLEDMSVKEIDNVTYARYVEERRESEATERRHEIVKSLLEKLPESERTVVTLYYLGEMTAKEIGKFLGVSVKTINSRLYRARNRLKEQENMIRETLGSVHMPTTFTENIVRQIADIKPVSSSSKPLIPVAISTATAVLVFLLIGVGTQYLVRFQKLYNLNATSELTVEIIEALFVLDTPAKPDVRNQSGSSTIPGKTTGPGQKPNAPLFAALPVDEAKVSTTQPQWIQTKGPQGGWVNALYVASNGDLYAGAGTDLYRATDEHVWDLINSSISFKGSGQMAEHGDTLYLVTDAELLASEDRGETWNSLGTRPEGKLIGIVTTNDAFYLGLSDGVFHSLDAGKSWVSLKDENLANKKIRTLATVENDLFVGTDAGLYRRNSDSWELLSVGEGAENIRALASSEHRLYVAVGEENKNQLTAEFMSMMTTRKASLIIYRSADLGNTWQAIDPGKDLPVKTSGLTFGITRRSEMGPTPSIKMVALKNNLLVLDSGRSYYSGDAGETWATLHSSFSDMDKPPVVVMLNENTFYRSGRDGVHRTTDAGKTWQQFNTGLVNTSIGDLVVVHNTLYANIGHSLLSSSDGGESWAPVADDPGNIIKMIESNGIFYARGSEGMTPRLFRLSAEDESLTPVSGMPSLGDTGFDERMSEEISLALLDTLHEDGKQSIETGEKLNPDHFDADKFNEVYSKIMEKTMADSVQMYLGSFAISDGTYYMESRQKLFRWKPGTTEWHDTGLTDEGEDAYTFTELTDLTTIGFKVAASGDTVYVGKRSGHLFQSYDEGNTWKDITADLPFSITSFNAITFAGSTIYVATDKGVTYSTDGTRWHTATDVEREPVLIEKFAVAGTTVYAATQQRVYQLKQNSGIWQPVTSEVPGTITSLAINNSTLYVGTRNRGVLRFALDESSQW